MTNDKLQETIAAMDDGALAALQTSVLELQEQRAGVDIGMIKPGMSADDRARVLAAIQRTAPR